MNEIVKSNKPARRIEKKNNMRRTRGGGYARGQAAIPVLDIAATREGYNPLKSLTIDKAVLLYDQYKRGEYGDIQLVWDALEEYDELLGTLVEKRESALLDIDCSITVDNSRIANNASLQSLAEEQQAFLDQMHSKINNFTEALSWLSLASFRGFSHLEIVPEADGTITLDPVEQWYWRRFERRGNWYYNPSSYPQSVQLQEVDMSRLIVREVRSAINIVAMFSVVKKSHAEAGWDGFLDVFGNPSLFFETPPGMTDAQKDEMDKVMQNLLGDGRGTYPSGGKIVPVETVADKGENFRARMESADKAMVLRATGGLLTVLTESGSGTLAGTAHLKAWEMIAGKEARAIASVMNDQFYHPLLDAKFGYGCPKLAGLNFAVAPDDTVLVDKIIKLAEKRWRASDELVSEITGIEVTSESLDPRQLYAAGSMGFRPTMMDEAGTEQSPITNREKPMIAEPLSEEERNKLKDILALPRVDEVQALSKQIGAVMEEELKTGLEEATKDVMPSESKKG